MGVSPFVFIHNNGDYFVDLLLLSDASTKDTLEDIKAASTKSRDSWVRGRGRGGSWLLKGHCR